MALLPPFSLDGVIAQKRTTLGFDDDDDDDDDGHKIPIMFRHLRH
jgi:hypothetical protein